MAFTGTLMHLLIKYGSLLQKNILQDGTNVPVTVYCVSIGMSVIGFIFIFKVLPQRQPPPNTFVPIQLRKQAPKEKALSSGNTPTVVKSKMKKPRRKTKHKTKTSPPSPASPLQRQQEQKSQAVPTCPFPENISMENQPLPPESPFEKNKLPELAPEISSADKPAQSEQSPINTTRQQLTSIATTSSSSSGIHENQQDQQADQGPEHSSPAERCPLVKNSVEEGDPEAPLLTCMDKLCPLSPVERQHDTASMSVALAVDGPANNHDGEEVEVASAPVDDVQDHKQQLEGTSFPVEKMVDEQEEPHCAQIEDEDPNRTKEEIKSSRVKQLNIVIPPADKRQLVKANFAQVKSIWFTATLNLPRQYALAVSSISHSSPDWKILNAIDLQRLPKSSSHDSTRWQLKCTLPLSVQSFRYRYLIRRVDSLSKVDILWENCVSRVATLTQEKTQVLSAGPIQFEGISALTKRELDPLFDHQMWTPTCSPTSSSSSSSTASSFTSNPTPAEALAGKILNVKPCSYPDPLSCKHLIRMDSASSVETDADDLSNREFDTLWLQNQYTAKNLRRSTGTKKAKHRSGSKNTPLPPLPPSPVTMAPPRVSFNQPLFSIDFLVMEQVVYYFSAENLVRDLFLRRHMDAQGYVSIPLIGSFNRIRLLAPGMPLPRLIEVLAQSPSLEVFASRHSTGELIIPRVSMAKVRTRCGWERWVLKGQNPEVASLVYSPAV